MRPYFKDKRDAIADVFIISAAGRVSGLLSTIENQHQIRYADRHGYTNQKELIQPIHFHTNPVEWICIPLPFAEHRIHTLILM